MVTHIPDEIDFKLLQLLQADARLDVVQLARLVNLTKTPVHKRLLKLQETGIIRGFTALLDREKIGQPVLVMVQVKLKALNRISIQEFVAAVEVLPPVQSCLYVSGDWDFVLQVGAETPKAYNDFLMETICSLNNVAAVESSFVLRECKMNGNLILSAKFKKNGQV